jgi:acyl carrier protein
MRLVFAVGLMLLAGLVTATMAMITVRLMQAHDAASDRQPARGRCAQAYDEGPNRACLLSAGGGAAGHPHLLRRVVVDDTDDPIKDYGADSLDMLELTQTLEDRFGYHIPDDEVDQLRTVGDFIRWYEQHVAMEPATR